MKITTPNCPKWLAERKKIWQELDDNMRYEDTKEMNETLSAQKCWFIDGDLKPLMNNPDSLYKQDALALSNILEFCPCTDIDEFTQFIKDYCYYLSEQKLDYWGPWYEMRDKKFIADMFGRFSSDNSMTSMQLQGHFLGLLLPDENDKVIFPFPIGGDKWCPVITISTSWIVRNLIRDMGRYLFSDKEESNNYEHLKEGKNFIKSNLHRVDPIIFAIDLAEERYEKKDGEKINSAGQKNMRRFLGRLAGYDVEYETTYHHDLAVETELREAFANADMPQEYYQLMAFIHEHKENCVDP